MAKVKAKKPAAKRKPIRVTLKAPVVVKPSVFQDCHHRTFLLLEEKDGYNRYITVRDEEMQVIKLEHDLPARDKDGQLLTQETTSTTELHPVLTPEGQPYNLRKAALKLYDSLIVRTYDATKELCILLGKPIPEIPEAVLQARKAAAERLVAARAQRRSNLEAQRSTNLQSTSTTKEHTMSKKVAAKKTTTKPAVAKTNGNGTEKITLLVKENPKREGTDSFKRFALYGKSKTVADFLKAGGTTTDLRWDEAHKFIKVST